MAIQKDFNSAEYTAEVIARVEAARERGKALTLSALDARAHHYHHYARGQTGPYFEGRPNDHPTPRVSIRFDTIEDAESLDAAFAIHDRWCMNQLLTATGSPVHIKAFA